MMENVIVCGIVILIFVSLANLMLQIIDMVNDGRDK